MPGSPLKRPCCRGQASQKSVQKEHYSLRSSWARKIRRRGTVAQALVELTMPQKNVCQTRWEAGGFHPPKPSQRCRSWIWTHQGFQFLTLEGGGHNSWPLATVLTSAQSTATRSYTGALVGSHTRKWSIIQLSRNFSCEPALAALMARKPYVLSMHHKEIHCCKRILVRAKLHPTAWRGPCTQNLMSPTLRSRWMDSLGGSRQRQSTRRY